MKNLKDAFEMAVNDILQMSEDELRLEIEAVEDFSYFDAFQEFDGFVEYIEAKASCGVPREELVTKKASGQDFFAYEHLEFSGFDYDCANDAVFALAA